MKAEFKDDTFLSRWLGNELSGEELKAFEASEDFGHYQKIVAGTNAIVPSSFDEDKILDAIRTAVNRKEKTAITRKMWAYSIAASVVVLFGAIMLNVGFNSGAVMVTSEFGEQKTIILPDGSEMTLNSRSEVSFNEKKWEETPLP